MNEQLRGTYIRLNTRLGQLKKESIENLQGEWIEWFQMFNIPITDDSVDAAVTVASGMVKQAANIIGEPTESRSTRRKAQRRYGPVAKTLLDQGILSVAVLASLRPTQIKKEEGNGSE